MARGASGARRPRREPASRVPGCPGAPRGRARRLPFALPPARRGGEPTRGPPRRGARGCWLLSWAAKAEGGGRGPPRRRAETKKMCPVRSNDIFPMPRGTGAARSVAGPPPGRPRGGAARLHHATPSRLHHAIPPAAASPQTATGHLPAPPSLSPQVRPGSQAKASLSGTGGFGVPCVRKILHLGPGALGLRWLSQTQKTTTQQPNTKENKKKERLGGGRGRRLGV